MHWMTAIFGLLGLYGLCGVGYSLIKAGPGELGADLAVWLGAIAIAIAGVCINQWRVRRKQRAATPAPL